MAVTPVMLRTCGLLLYLTFQVHSSAVKTPELILQSLKVGSVSCDDFTCKYLLNVSGAEFLGHYAWRLTPEKGAKGSSCEIIYANYEIKEIATLESYSQIEVSVPYVHGKIYFCLQRKVKNTPFGFEWVHQGIEHFLEPKNDSDSTQKDLSLTAESKSSSSQDQDTDTQSNQTLEDEDDTQETNTDWADLTHDTDVNYLPSVSRPTREDEEKLFNEKYGPLSDRLNQLKINWKRTVDRLKEQFYDGDDDDDYIKNKVIKNNYGKKLQEDNVRHTIDRDNAKNIVVNNGAEDLDAIKNKRKNDVKKIYEKTDAILLQANKFDNKMAEVQNLLKQINVLPIYKTLQEIAAKYYSNDESIQKLMAAPYPSSKSSDMSVREKIENVMKQQSKADTLTRSDVKFDKKRDKFDKELEVLMSMVQSNKIKTKMGQITELMDKIDPYPIYAVLQEFAAKWFPDDECIQALMSAPRPSYKRSPTMSVKDKFLNLIKQRNKTEKFTSSKDGKFVNDKDKFDKELEVLMLMVNSNNTETKLAEIRDVMDKIDPYPIYANLQEFAAKWFPDDEQVQRMMAAPRPNFKSSEIPVQEISQEVRKIDLNYGNDKDKFNKELDVLMSMVQSNKIETKMEEITEMMDKIDPYPIYKTLQEFAAKWFPNNKCIQRLMIAPRPKEKALEMASHDTFFPKAKTPDTFFPNAKTPDAFFPNARTSETFFRNAITPETSSPETLISDTPAEDLAPKTRRRRQLISEDFTIVRGAGRPIIIEGLRIEDSDKEPRIEDGIPSVLAESAVTLRVYGEGLTPNTVIAFTHDPQPYGMTCKFLLKGEYKVKEGSLQPRTALFEIRAPAPITSSKLYICAKNLEAGNSDPTRDEEQYLHQGMETWKMIASHNKLLPLWVSICLILFCLMFSALFSGLNLGLMSLDRTELKIISNTGTEQERKYARAIMPVRDHGNYLLCSILLGNVAVNSTFTILLDELTSGLFAVIFSTLAIVLLGEITPQAICSRHGLMVGAKSIMVTKGVMAVTAPLSFPVSKLLDYFLGEEIGNVYNRERLKELVKVTTDVNDLDKDEVNIISGALEMRKKMVRDVMTKLEDVFMLPITSVLDFETMSEIVKSGYSRIPVYENGRGNIVTVLFIKDLAFVDPDDNTPLRTLCQYYQNPAHFVFEDVTLDVMFKQFKDGHKGHMAFVHRINNEGEGDPFYETIGLVTLEDVIEEMIQSEIVDETDVFLDNRSKRRRRPQNKLQDFAAFAERHENQRIHISPQLTLATFQFLSTSVDAFRPDTVSETVLKRLLKQDVIQYIKIKGKTRKDPSTYVFQQGKPVDYFLLILEGRVEVTVGRENLVFEAGPFTYFGVQALTQNVGVAESPTPSAMGSLQNINMDAMLRHTFVPDYSVRAITSVYYLTVKRSLYLAAKRATLMEKSNISKGGTTQEFDTEVDKLLQSVDEDLSITGEHKTPSRQVSPHPMPVSPAPRAIDSRNGHAYVPASTDEQERLLK